jgi:hypothetical protein
VASRPIPLPAEEERLVAARQRWAAVAQLGQHANWPALVDTFEAEVEKKFKSLRHRIYAGGVDAPEIPQREIDYHRGWMDGAKWALAQPRVAENKLKRNLKESDGRTLDD